MPNALQHRRVFSLEEAAGAAPSLAALQERIRTSQRCLERVQHLIPQAMRRHVKAGPLQDSEWCLLVGNAAASAKLRQLQPALLQALGQSGLEVSAIRIKVQTAPK